MDKEDLQNRLHKYMSLICGKDNVDTVFAIDVSDDKFIIGYEKDGVRQVSRITRQIAICLAADLNYYMVRHKKEFEAEMNKNKKVKRCRTR
jgi:hypothetical protein